MERAVQGQESLKKRVLKNAELNTKYGISCYGRTFIYFIFWAALSPLWVIMMSQKTVVLVLYRTYQEVDVPLKISCAQWELSDTIVIRCEILQMPRWPPFTLKQVHHHVGNGCVVVMNRFNLSESQRCFIENVFIYTEYRFMLKKWTPHALTFPSTVAPFS